MGVFRVPPSRHQVPRLVASHVADRVTELLQERGLSERDLQRSEGISTGTIHKWKTGEGAPSLGVLLHLVDVFELCSIEEILGGPLGTRIGRSQHRHR